MALGILQQAALERARQKAKQYMSVAPTQPKAGMNINTSYSSFGVPKVANQTPMPYKESPLGKALPGTVAIKEAVQQKSFAPVNDYLSTKIPRADRFVTDGKVNKGELDKTTNFVGSFSGNGMRDVVKEPFKKVTSTVASKVSKITPEIKDKLYRTLSLYDDTPLTVNGAPYLKDIDTEFRITELKNKVDKGFNLTSKETEESLGILKQRGIDIFKEAETKPLLAKPNTKESTFTKAPNGRFTGSKKYAPQTTEAYGAVAGFEFDEEGNMTYNPTKGALGFAGMTAVNKGKKFFTKAGTDELRTHLEIAKETLANHPAKNLVKFTNKRTGELPEVLGREYSGMGKKVSEFGRKGDSTITQYGFEDSESARRAMEDYKLGQKRVAELEAQYKQARQSVKDEAMSGLKTADQLQTPKPPHLKFDADGRPLAYTAKQRAILEGTDQVSTLNTLQKLPQKELQPPLLSQPLSHQSLLKKTENVSSPQEGLLAKTQQKELQTPIEKLRPKVGGVGESFESIVQKTQTPVNAKVNLLDYIRTPDRVLKKMGLGKNSVEIRRQYDKYLEELPKNINKITDWSKQTTKEGNIAIFKYLDGEDIKLAPTEERVAKEIQTWLSDWAERLKLPHDRRISSYITHIFEPDFLAKEFDEDLAKIIQNKVPGSVYDPFLQERLGAKGYVQDTWRALDAYVKRGTRKVHMDPALEKLKEASKNLEQSQFNYVKRYADRVNLRPTELDTMFDNLIKSVPGVGYKLGQRPVAFIGQKARRAVYRAFLGGNVSSALRNLSQGANTYAKLGEKYTTVGYLNLLKNGTKELEEVGVLRNNIIEDRVLNASHKFWETTDKGLFYLFDKAEKINRGAAYYGAKAKALKQGMSEADAINYGKDMVRDTQFTFGSVDTPVALQNDLVKLFSQFQSYTVKQAEFLGEMLQKKEFAGLVRYGVASLTFAFTIGKLFGMEPKQILPNLRFDTPPTMQAGVETLKALADTPDEYGGDRTTSKKVSDVSKKFLNFIPGSTQAKKTYEGLKAYNEGGSFTKAGNLQYEIPQTTENKIRTGLFGKYSIPEARQYFDKREGKLKDKTIQKFEKEETEKATENKKESYKLYQEIKQLPKGQKAQKFNEIASKDETMARKILAHIEDEKLTPKDKQIKSLGVESGARAKYLFSQFNKLKTKEEKKALWIDLVDKKILTEEVWAQVTFLMEHPEKTK